ncbi:hypothetical protein K9M48_03625 [Candidatus Gracilibacteria bacterium]|nr:hypothetical protein [Candidatus Gracilibacteria bacterium]
MKNFALILIIFLNVSIASSQNLFWYDMEALVNDNIELLPTVRSLSMNVACPNKPLILSGDTMYKEYNLIERFVVFEHSGYRFSIYYQWEPSAMLLIDNPEALTIYYRPIGTDDPDNLKKICDYYINGSWDEFDNGIYIYRQYMYDERWEDPIIQKEYHKIAKIALEYFTK